VFPEYVAVKKRKVDLPAIKEKEDASTLLYSKGVGIKTHIFDYEEADRVLDERYKVGRRGHKN